jgi:hypothetical protein
MVSDDLFARPQADDREPRLVVHIAGQRFDFREIRAMRDAAAVIVGLPTRDARRAAVEQIPPGYREMVVILVERAFYQRGLGG